MISFKAPPSVMLADLEQDNKNVPGTWWILPHGKTMRAKCQAEAVAEAMRLMYVTKRAQTAVLIGLNN
jgi:hypothetical protein